MVDHARSDHAGVQRALDRLAACGPGRDILGLERITALLDRLGNPHRQLPPVFHIAGTNGKGSTCAFLRAAIEAAGLGCHVYTSPHLVRFNERIRLNGKLIDDDWLAALLDEVLDAAVTINPSFFEATTAAAFLAFARTPADACVIEVGLGGRLDATNVIPAPLVTGIAQLGIDHQSFLGDTLEAIAREKAGIAKSGVPLVTMRYPPSIKAVVGAIASAAGAVVHVLGEDWQLSVGDDVRYADANGTVTTPPPVLAGRHQPENLGLAMAMLRHQTRLAIPDEALRAAALEARWPARMQRLAPGPLRNLLHDQREIWLDGGHNAAAGEAIALALDRPVHIICGMLANKDAEGFLRPFADRIASFQAVPVDGHDGHPPAMLARLAAERLGVHPAHPADDVAAALGWIAVHGTDTGPVLICGSLYLAGRVLLVNDELPA